MRVLLDADLVLEALLNRNTSESRYADSLWEIIETQQVEGYITEVGLHQIHFFVTKLKPELAEYVISQIGMLVSICPIDRPILDQLRSSRLLSLKAAIDLICADTMDLDAIITKSPEDFHGTKIAIYSIGDFLDKLHPNRIVLHRESLERIFHLPAIDEAIAFDNELSIERKPINLNNWFEKIFDNTWQSIGDLPDKKDNLYFNFRSRKSNCAQGVKIIKFVDNSCNLKRIFLILNLSKAENKVSISVQVHPANREEHLPLGIALNLLSSGQILQEVISRSRDKWIQLKRFSCDPQTSFSIQVSINNQQFIESFFV